MRNNETGEFELVLGNKQLLGGFFIIVILFCVFFSMGYILGRNSAPVGRTGEPAAAAAPPVTEQPAPVVQPPAAAPQQPASEQPKPAEGAAPTAGETPQPGTQPVREQPAAAAPAPSAQAAPAEPVPGETYLQVMAVKKQEAEVVVKTLKDKGFPALMGPGPNELVRVLVGPYKDGTSLGQAKAGLEKAGFQPIVKKG
jgi:cell division septation protein DedD